jgi:hypothetical protein
MSQFKLTVKCHDSQDNERMLELIKEQLVRKFKTKPTREVFASRLEMYCLDIGAALGFDVEFKPTGEIIFTDHIAIKYGYTK